MKRAYRYVKTWGLAALAAFIISSPVLAGTLVTATFVRGKTDASLVSTGTSIPLQLETYLLTFKYREKRGPISGTIAMLPGSAVFVVNNRLHDELQIFPETEGVKTFEIVYEDNRVVGFNIDYTSGIVPNIGSTDRSLEQGIISVKGNQDGVDVKFTEDHAGTAPISYGDWDGSVPFGKSVEREPTNQMCWELTTEIGKQEFGFEVSSDTRCFWMENRTRAYCWVDAPQGEISKARCKQLDSCSGGDGASGGGCYKYSNGSLGPRQSW